MKSRKSVLNDLLNLSPNLNLIKRSLAELGWNSEDIVYLTKSHVKDLLTEYLQSGKTAEYVNEWANIVESREDIGYEHPDEGLLKRIIFELANPEINSQLTTTIAKEYYEMLC